MWPPRVLFLIDSLEPSGAEWSLLAMAPHLLAQGVGMEIVHFGSRAGLGPRFEALGVLVTATPGRRTRFGRIAGAREAIRRHGPDLVHTTLFEADVAGRVAARSYGVPIVSSLVNTAYGTEHRQATQIQRWKLQGARALDAVTAKAVDRFHAISHTVAREMATRLFISPSRIDVVPRGRDPDTLGLRSPERRARVRAALGIHDSVPVLLSVARHEHQKALHVAVGALEQVRAQHPHARLLVAGREGNATADLRHSVGIAGLDASVDLLGQRDDVPDLLAAADVFVFPSRWEGLGSVLLEAMALEIPIVASDLPVLREVLVDEDGTELGWFAGVDDAGAFARGCLDALTHADGRVRRARERFLRHYTAQSSASGISDIYRRVLRP